MPHRLAQQPLVTTIRNQPYLNTIRRYIHTNIATNTDIQNNIGTPTPASVGDPRIAQIYDVLKIIIERHMEQIRRNEYAYDNPGGIIRDVENRV